MADPAPALAVPFGSPGSSTAGFVQHVAHEIRQPLSAIDSIAYYLKMLLPEADPRVHPQLDRIQALVSQANSVIASAVLLASPATPGTDIIDLNQVVSSVVAENAGEGCADEPSVHIQFASDPALVRLNADHARHLVSGMLTSLVQVSRSSEPILARIHNNDAREVELEFQAPGWQCATQDLAGLFEPLNAQLPPGVGLILSSARRITEVHGGRISVKSETGRGTWLQSTFPPAG